MQAIGRVAVVAAGGQCGGGGGEEGTEGTLWDFVRMGLYYDQAESTPA